MQTADDTGRTGRATRTEERPTIMTLDEVASYLRVHRSTVYRMAREGSIPTTKIANQWRFKKERIDSWLLEREQEASGS